jgi:ADP-ribosylglycohydrolase
MEKKQDKSIDKFAGGLMGLVIADTLAYPLKFLSHEERKQFLPVQNLVEPHDFKKLLEDQTQQAGQLKHRAENWFPAGYYSFYSQQALLLFDSIFTMGAVDLEDISQKLVKYSFPRDRYSPLGVFRGYNRQFYDAIQNIANGMPLKLCGITNCIGDAAIKFIPVGMYYGFETHSIKDKSVEITLLTHRDIHAVGSSAALGYTVAQTSAKPYFNIDDELKKIVDFTRTVENYATDRFGDFFQDSYHNRNLLSQSINELNRLKNEPVDEGIRYYKNLANQHRLKYNSSLVTCCSSLLIFIKNIGNYDHAIKCALEQDIDIEIVAPLVGALSGSLLGAGKIPKPWKHLFKERKEIYQKVEFLKAENAEKPSVSNYYIKEIELSEKQFNQKSEIMNKIDEKLPVIA